MELQLNNKKVFISGSTSGIGFAMALGFLNEGAEVTIHGRSQNSVDQAISRLKLSFPEGRIDGVFLDFSMRGAIENIQDQVKEVDILINNVGIYTSKPFADTSDEDWYSMFQVNVMSGVQLSRYFLPKMIDKNWGRILFVSSECAQLVPEDLIAYSSTKAAILSLSRGLAQTTKGTNVTVNSILPGSTLTEGAQTFLKEQALKEDITEDEIAANFFKNVRTSSLVQRFTSPKEISDMAIFLSSPLGSATNGAAIKVDGGSIPGMI